MDGTIPVVAEQGLDRRQKLARYQDEIAIKHSQDVQERVVARDYFPGFNARDMPLRETGLLG